MAEGVASSRVIAEHPRRELVEKRDDHTRIWEIAREVETTHPDGSATVDTVKSYIHEKASGLCYKDASGAYVPSVAEWRETPDGFVLDRCAYGLAMGKTIGVTARYTVEGNDLLLRPAHLIVSDGVNRADLATLNPQTPGFISPDNPSVLRFPSAFGEGYDLEYIAEKGGFHQNLIISNPPELPEGFNSATASIHLYTELNLDQYLSASGLEVRILGAPVDTSAPDLVTAPARGGSISFRRPGGPGAGPGELIHLFGAGAACDSPPPGVPPKEMLSEERLLKNPRTGAAYVVDSLPWSYFADGGAPFYPVIWDPPELKSGGITTDTWLSGVTYHVTDNVTVSGLLTIQGGAFVKINAYKQIGIDDGKVVAEGQAGQYVKFTKAEDDTAGWGEETSNPTQGPFGNGLYLYSGSSSQSIIRYCMMRYGICAINCQQPQEYAFEHNIIDGKGAMYYGIKVGTGGEVDCINNLIYDSSWLGIEYYSASAARVCSNTIHGGNVGIQLQYSDVGTITDNLLTGSAVCGVGVDANSTVTYLDFNGFWNCTTPVAGEDMGENSVELDECPYEVEGKFYLDQSCELLIENGSQSALDAELEKHTTCEDGDRDRDTVDIGFHYWSYVDLEANDLYGALAPAGELSPGGYVHYNIDSDNLPNAIKDYLEDTTVANEDDLKQLKILVEDSVTSGVVVLSRTNAKVQVWKSPTKGTSNKILTGSTYQADTEGNGKKTWDLSNPTQRQQFNSLKNSLYVEGRDKGTGALKGRYECGDINVEDTVNYTFIGATCGSQPDASRRSVLQGSFPNLVGCEYSVTWGQTGSFNCIAWSVQITNDWVHFYEVDEFYGNHNHVYETDDFDGFYGDHNYTVTTDIAEAEVFLYKDPSQAYTQTDEYGCTNPLGITHAARIKAVCNCGAGKWIMWESKCGGWERLEHRNYQLNGTGAYGSPYRYYKPE